MRASCSWAALLFLLSYSIGFGTTKEQHASPAADLFDHALTHLRAGRRYNTKKPCVRCVFLSCFQKTHLSLLHRPIIDPSSTLPPQTPYFLTSDDDHLGPPLCASSEMLSQCRRMASPPVRFSAPRPPSSALGSSSCLGGITTRHSKLDQAQTPIVNPTSTIESYLRVNL